MFCQSARTFAKTSRAPKTCGFFFRTAFRTAWPAGRLLSRAWRAKLSSQDVLERRVGPFARQVVPFAPQVGPFARQVGLQDSFLTSKVGFSSPSSDRQDAQNRAPVQARA